MTRLWIRYRSGQNLLLMFPTYLTLLDVLRSRKRLDTYTLETFRVSIKWVHKHTKIGLQNLYECSWKTTRGVRGKNHQKVKAPVNRPLTKGVGVRLEGDGNRWSQVKLSRAQVRLLSRILLRLWQGVTKKFLFVSRIVLCPRIFINVYLIYSPWFRKGSSKLYNLDVTQVVFFFFTPGGKGSDRMKSRPKVFNLPYTMAQSSKETFCRGSRRSPGTSFFDYRSHDKESHRKSGYRLLLRR